MNAVKVEYKAYLRVREHATGEIVDSIGLTSLNEKHVDRVIMGLLRDMNTDIFGVDDSEVDEALDAEMRRRCEETERAEDYDSASEGHW